MFPIWRFGSEEQKQRWLPRMAAGEVIGCFGLTEPDAGSDPAAMRTQRPARRRRLGPERREDVDHERRRSPTSPSCGRRRDDGIRGFVVPRDTPGFTTPGHPPQALAARVGDLRARLRRRPAARRTPSCPASPGCKGPLSCLNEARYGIVWGVVGAARACLETALEYAKTREQFGRPIAGVPAHPARSSSNMLLELQKAQLLALHLGRLKDEGRVAPEQVSVGKLNNVREALAIAREARTILGANGITLEYPVMRHAENLESVLTYEGTSEIHTLILGQAMTGESAFT